MCGIFGIYEQESNQSKTDFLNVDVSLLRSVGAVSEKTAAILIEPIQGEGGIRVLPQPFLKEIRAICDEKNILGICRELNNLVNKTRQKNIRPDELQGSTFTISNFGVFDALIGTPIINQPNVGILGTGKIKKQPIVIEKNNTDIIE